MPLKVAATAISSRRPSRSFNISQPDSATKAGAVYSSTDARLAPPLCTASWYEA